VLCCGCQGPPRSHDRHCAYDVYMQYTCGCLRCGFYKIAPRIARFSFVGVVTLFGRYHASGTISHQYPHREPTRRKAREQMQPQPQAQAQTKFPQSHRSQTQPNKQTGVVRLDQVIFPSSSKHLPPQPIPHLCEAPSPPSTIEPIA